MKQRFCSAKKKKEEESDIDPDFLRNTDRWKTKRKLVLFVTRGWRAFFSVSCRTNGETLPLS